MKSNKGVTLVALVLTVVLLIILTFTITINVDQYGEQKMKTNFEKDMVALREEINQYYARVKELPIINRYTNIEMLQDIKNVNDNDKYYVIDLGLLDVKLNYGKDYNIIKEKDLNEEIVDILDIYIINEQSHTIYYPKGITYNGETHYKSTNQYSQIENIFFTTESQSYNISKRVNKPELLAGMTPIKFVMPTEDNMGSTIITNEQDENWYEYGTSYETKRWANVKTRDGSMWVWIPRYAYKITYYTDNTYSNIANNVTKYGKIDVVFLIGTTDNYYDENGELKTAQRQKTIDEIIDTTKDYTVHPAFTNETAIAFANGGWDKELTGIWVAKFEAGYASGNNDAPVVASSVNYNNYNNQVWAGSIETGSSDGYLSARNWLDGVYGETTTSIKYPTFQGTTYSMNYINHNDAYNISKALTNSGNIYGLNSENADSHLMKNSEWGAITYLSYSKYGTNGNEITINNANLNSGESSITKENGNVVASVYAVTGCTSNSTSAGNIKTTISEINGVSKNTPNAQGIYVWNQKIGQNASSTSTIYGIYDMSGGLWEKTNAYVNNGNVNLQKHSESITYENGTLKTSSTKYTTIYPNNEAGITNLDTASQANFSLNTKIYGDSVRETTISTAGTSNTGWNTSSWNSDYTAFPGLSRPFFERAGSIFSGNKNGVFAFTRDDGINSYERGFRAVLVAK